LTNAADRLAAQQMLQRGGYYRRQGKHGVPMSRCRGRYPPLLHAGLRGSCRPPAC